MDDRQEVKGWEALMLRWGAPATYVGVVFLAGLLLVGILLRSPDTKSNFQAARAGYHRTTLSTIGVTGQYMGIGSAALPTDGKGIYVEAGCASCHGLHGAGGAVGPAIWSTSATTIGKTVRSGGNGMPAFDANRLSDEQIAKIVDYLKAMKTQNPNEPEVIPHGEAAHAAQ